MAHLHGGYFDPNNPSSQPPQIPHAGGGYSAHGGAYTPGSSIVSYQNQPYQPPSQPVSPVSPISPQSQVAPFQGVPLGHYQQYPPPPQVYTQPSNHQYQQPTMSYNQQQPPPPQQQQQQGGYPMQQGSSQEDGFMQTKGPATGVELAQFTPVDDSTPKAEKEFPVSLKGSKHFSEPRSTWRLRNPRLFQQPGYVFNDAERLFRHRDYAGRVAHKPRSDRYLHHNDGYLRNLYVACTDDIYTGPGTSTWKRTYVRKVAPLKVRIATWVIDFTYDPESWQDWGIMILRALPAAIAMSLCFWDSKSRFFQRQLFYAPVLYAYHGDAKVWNNMLENRKEKQLLGQSNEVYRQLRPRYLCFLREQFSDQNKGVDVRVVEDWERTQQEDANLNYLFVAYSTEHFSHLSEQDMMALHHIAETACRAAKLPAYWVACSCMRDPGELESDVYRISDVVRGAHSMVIAVGRGKTAMSSGKVSTEGLLQEWGSRMWTFPEVLLSPGRSILVYTRDGDLNAPLNVAKNQFPAQVWPYMDSHVARHLIDHYLGSISLSRLELAVLALRCLYSRHTTEYFPGDQAYALMGLLRMRPHIDSTDTAFQAFSRLSLANDSDKLLERYICTLPNEMTQPWYNMDDTYKSSLWDITPHCEVAGIADNDTVIIDGAYGVSVRWKTFYSVYWSTGPSWKRFISEMLLEWNGAIFIAAIALLSQGASYGAYGSGMIGAGVVFLLIFLYVWAMTPTLVRIIYGGKFCETQAEMFGFEGHLNAATIERCIFGGNFSRFTWSPNGSPLSRSVINEHGERVGMDPYKDPEIRMKVEAAKQAGPGQMRIFTLVDTYNMQLTLFESVRPPVTLMFCGSEGGMQRAVGCSYEWETQTMYRETVLRLPTTTLNRMDRVPRFKMGIQRTTYASSPREGQV